MTKRKMSWAVACALVAAGMAGGCGRDANVTIGVGPRRAHDAQRTGAPGAAGANASMDATGPAAVTGAPAVSRLEPFELDQTGADNPAGLPEDEVKQLMAGGPSGDVRFLYPYDGTVFPEGLLAPALMWQAGASPDAAYLHIQSRAFDYKTVIRPGTAARDVFSTAQPQLRLPQAIWNIAGRHSLGKQDAFRVELTLRVGGVAAGPIVTHFTIAPASLKGVIYYQTYGAKFDQLTTAGSGDIVRLPFGGSAERVISAGNLSGTCYGCHAVAANGARLTLQSIDQLAPAGMQTKGWLFALDAAGPQPDPPITIAPDAAFAALYPDGSKFLSSSQDVSLALSNLYQIPDRLGTQRSFDATLYDVETGRAIEDTGIPKGALMPMFSPDGTRLVFTDYARNSARALAVMDYDMHADRASNYRVLAQEPPGPDEPMVGSALTTGGMRPGWPFFLPDDRAVVFVRTDSKLFGSGLLGQDAQNVTPPGSAQPVTNDLTRADASDLYIVDLASGSVTPLARAMGFDSPEAFAADRTYLPFDDDAHHNYFPTTLPVAAGGYFWVFFDSLRHYGDLGLQRQLWGAAIDILPEGAGYAVDPSHPPFYLEGQELGPDNHRAFAALEVCRPEGTPCASGIECCTGYCSETCVPPTRDTCSKRDERCAASSECCNVADLCINGFCALVDLL